MLALGGFLTCLAILVLGALTPLFRDPKGPRWINLPLVGELATVAIVSVLALGIGWLGAGVIDASQQGVSLPDLGLLAAIVAVSVLIWRRLDVRARVRALEAKAGPAAPVPFAAANDPEGPAPVRPKPAGSSSSRRRAA